MKSELVVGEDGGLCLFAEGATGELEEDVFEGGRVDLQVIDFGAALRGGVEQCDEGVFEGRGVDQDALDAAADVA